MTRNLHKDMHTDAGRELHMQESHFVEHGIYWELQEHAQFNSTSLMIGTFLFCRYHTVLGHNNFMESMDYTCSTISNFEVDANIYNITSNKGF